MDYRKEGDRLFSRTFCDRTRGNEIKVEEGRFGLDILKKVIVNKVNEVLEQVAQKGGGCPIRGDTQGQADVAVGVPDVAVGVPVHCKGVGRDDLWESLPTQMIP